MTGEHDNPEQGTDNATPISDTDKPEDFDFYDPEEDNVEPETPTGTDDESIPAEPETEAEVEEEATPTEEAEPEPSIVLEDQEVTLADGSKKTVKELISGNMMQGDYTRKSQQVAEMRKQAEADANRIAGITEAIVDHLSGLIPAEPDMALAHSNPQAYWTQKAQRDQALQLVQGFMDQSEKVKEVSSGMTEAQRKERMAEENQRLAMVVPETATAEGRKAFFNNVLSVAEKVGFSREEVTQISDHRIFHLAKWAKMGIEAEAAKAKAQQKVEVAAQVTAKKPTGRSRADNSAAMQKLKKSGSIEDALMVDFE